MGVCATYEDISSRDAAFTRMGQRAITSVEADALKSFLELSVTSCGFHQLAQLTHTDTSVVTMWPDVNVQNPQKID